MLSGVNSPAFLHKGNSMTEKVLVIPTANVWKCLGRVNGFKPANIWLCNKKEMFDGARYLDRSLAEEDFNFKQLIPYIIIDVKIGTRTFVYSYTRASSSGESRLHSLKSVGFGGHINPDPDSTKNVIDWQNISDEYYYNLRRELKEELGIDSGGFKITTAGVINDESNDVGRVHLGVVHKLTINEIDLFSWEDSIADLKLIPISKLLDDYDNYENWSKLLIDNYLQSSINDHLIKQMRWVSIFDLYDGPLDRKLLNDLRDIGRSFDGMTVIRSTNLYSRISLWSSIPVELLEAIRELPSDVFVQILI